MGSDGKSNKPVKVTFRVVEKQSGEEILVGRYGFFLQESQDAAYVCYRASKPNTWGGVIWDSILFLLSVIIGFESAPCRPAGPEDTDSSIVIARGDSVVDVDDSKRLVSLSLANEQQQLTLGAAKELEFQRVVEVLSTVCG